MLSRENCDSRKEAMGGEGGAGRGLGENQGRERKMNQEEIEAMYKEAAEMDRVVAEGSEKEAAGAVSGSGRGRCRQ